MGLSAGTGPTIGALLVGTFGWTSIFLANVPVLLLSAALAHLGAPPRPAAVTPAAPRPRFDVVGSVLLGDRRSSGSPSASRPPTSAGPRCSGSLGLVPFALWERRAADPVIDFSLFSRRAFVGGSLLIALQNFAMYSTSSSCRRWPGACSTSARARRHDAAGDDGDDGDLSRPRGARLPTASARARWRSPAARSPWPAWSCSRRGPWARSRTRSRRSSLLGAGLGLTSAPSQSAAMSDVPREKSGMAAGLTSTMRYIGGIAGLTVLGLVLTDRPAGDVGDARAHARPSPSSARRCS